MRILQEKKKRELHRVFVDLEKAYDRIPRFRWMENIRRYQNIWPRRPIDGRQEDVVKDGGNGRHMLSFRFLDLEMAKTDLSWH